MSATSARRALAEFLGTGLLVAIVVGSGISAQHLSPDDIGLQLLENSTATALGLTVLILVFSPVSGAHLNPVVTLADHVLNRVSRSDDSSRPRALAVYLPAQLAGGIGGAMMANVMFALPPVTASTHTRTAAHLWLGEVVATAGLILLIFSLTRTGRAHLTAPTVGAYIGAAYWFTSSTSFANPAVTIGRAFTNTFAGIAPSSLAGFVGAQLVGAALGVALVAVLYPATAAGRAAEQVQVHPASADSATSADAHIAVAGYAHATPDQS